MADNRRKFRLIGAIVLAGVVGLGVLGIVQRNSSEASLKTWTDDQAIPSVSLLRPQPMAGTGDLALPATIQAYYESPIYARVSGYLKSWSRDIGAHVRQGEVLAIIDTPDLDQQRNQALANLASAQSEQRLAELTARRWRGLLASNSVSQQTVDEKTGAAEAKHAAVEAAEADLDRLNALESFKRVVAPFDGVVTARQTDVGALIDAGSGRGPELFRVADLHEMRVYVPVPQAYSAELGAGTTADLTVPQYPSRTFGARLDTTSNAVDEKSRTVLFELLAPNADGKLLPGMYGTIHFKLPAGESHLEIPTSAVIFQEDGTQLAVLQPDDTVALKTVKLGRDSGTRVEVLSGLTPQDQVIDSPPDSLSAGDKVKPLQPPAAALANAAPRTQ